nr:MAG TPA: hypothetical protein [Microviridae sp.]
MGFGKSFISGLGTSTASQGVGFIGNALSQAFGLSWSPEKAMREQWKYNKDIMALQNQYEQQAAAQSQQYAKDFWDYTNTESQVQHLKNAGLNIGLMYGQSGAGGMGASGGAHQSAPDQPQGNPVGMALQVQQIEQQRRMNDAQIALAEAQAEKTKVEASKIGGVDIQESLARIENLLADTEKARKEGNVFEATVGLVDAQKKLTEKLEDKAYWDTELAKAKTGSEQEQKENLKVLRQNMINEGFKILEEWNNLKKDGRAKDIMNHINGATMNEQIRAFALNNAKTVAETALANAQNKLTAQQINTLAREEQLLIERAVSEKWDRETRRRQVEAFEKRVHDQNVNEKWGLVNEDLKMISDSALKAMDILIPW